MQDHLSKIRACLSSTDKIEDPFAYVKATFVNMSLPQFLAIQREFAAKSRGHSFWCLVYFLPLISRTEVANKQSFDEFMRVNTWKRAKDKNNMLAILERCRWRFSTEIQGVIAFHARNTFTTDTLRSRFLGALAPAVHSYSATWLRDIMRMFKFDTSRVALLRRFEGHPCTCLAHIILLDDDVEQLISSCSSKSGALKMCRLLKSYRTRLQIPATDLLRDRITTLSKRPRRTQSGPPKKKARVEPDEKSNTPTAEPTRACTICLSSESCALVMPCKHLCMCTPCSSTVKTCPICRTPIAHVIQAFIS